MDYDRAYKKASDPNFTTKENPLVVPAEEVRAERRTCANMSALHLDAARRNSPTHGQVYAGIMDMRYGG